ncbi:phage holin family protein, partial [Enterobacter hormaechei]|uniref:phage holin family protein n=1 Tax=Enterobacter hormaechei TaxID=158836 RepID=UPI000BB7083D
FYRRGASRHRKWVSRLAWLITVVYSSVPLADLCGIYPHSSWLTITANVLILTALVSVRGNVARLIDLLRH